MIQIMDCTDFLYAIFIVLVSPHVSNSFSISHSYSPPTNLKQPFHGWGIYPHTVERLLYQVIVGKRRRRLATMADMFPNSEFSIYFYSS